MRNKNGPCHPVLIASIAIVCAIATPSTSHRSVLLRNFARGRANQTSGSSGLAGCTIAFISEYYTDTERVSLLLPEAPRDTASDRLVARGLLMGLHATSSVYTLDARVLMNATARQRISLNVVILLGSTSTLLESDFSFASYCTGDCSFAIALTNPFDDERSFVNDVGTLAREMWPRSMLKLAVLASVGDTVLFADSLMARIAGRSYAPVGRPRLLGRCERKAGGAIRWRFADDLGPPMFLAAINAAIIENFPYAFVINSSSGGEQRLGKTSRARSFGGTEGWMVEEIVRSMRLRLNRKLVGWTDNSSLHDELYLRLHNATDDLVFGGFLQYPNPKYKTRYTVSYGAVHIAWMVPVTENVSLRGLIASFKPTVWYAIICTFVIGGLVKFLIQDIALLDIVGLVLGIAVYDKPKRTSSRIQFIAWALFGYFLTQFYLGSLADQLIRSTDEQIETIEELINSGLMLGGMEQHLDLLGDPEDEEAAADEHDRIMRTIRERYIGFKQQAYLEHFRDLIEGRNASLALLVMLNLTDISYKSSPERFHVVKEPVGRYPLALTTWEGFPYLSEFNYRIQRVVQAGLIKFWSNMATLYNENYYEETDDDVDPNILELIDLAAAFIVLMTGYLVGFCLLVVEVIFYPARILM